MMRDALHPGEAGYKNLGRGDGTETEGIAWREIIRRRST